MRDEQRRNRPGFSRPPNLRPPGSLPEAAAPAVGSRLFIWFGLVLLLALAVAVVILLPRLSPQQAPESVAPPSRHNESATVERPAESAAEAKPRAESVLREYLRLRARLELERAPVWGQPEWDRAVADVSHGDRLFVQNDFAQAETAYQRAVDRLHLIDASRSAWLIEALERGEQALANERIAEAVRHFEYASAIEAENLRANAGLNRAKVRGQVLALMEAGQRAEDRGALEDARTAFEQASQLDKAYQQALAARQRVAERIAQVTFRAAMSEAIRALDAGRYSVSEQALQTAEGLRPNDDSVRDLRHRLDAAQRQSALAGWREKARSKTTAEDWQSAMEAYQQALKVDPAAAFAVIGVEKARARLRLHRQIDHYLSRPDRLSSDEPLTNAERVLQTVGEVPAAEPRLTRKLIELRRMVAAARTPVKVELRSDGETEVVIYHVGHRGRFLRQQLELRPGTYTVVGSREGYRDVRQRIVVEPGAAPLIVTIRCEETI